MRLLASLVLTALLSFGQQGSTPTEESRLLFSQIDDIMKGLSQITGWKVKRKVPAAYISKDQLQEFIQKRLRETVKPEQVRIEALTLKMFGLIPEDFDLEKATIELVTEQAAAFYDYNRKRLFITETTGSFIEKRVALAHELAHALADQQFSLARYVHKGGLSDDSATAREAVMEGQATWLMWAYSNNVNGGTAKPPDLVLDSVRESKASGSSQEYPVFDKAPLYLRESLLFPYNAGLLFQDSVIEHSGRQGFSEIFSRPPTSTAEILHPGLYYQHRAPPKIEPPKPPRGKKYRSLTDGSVGEFDHRILIQQYVSIDEASSLAPHWRAGAFRLYDAKQDRELVLTYASEWDSGEAAAQWFGHLKRLLEQRNPPDRVNVAMNDRRVTAVVSRAVK